MAGKKFSLFEVILSVICVVFTIEAAAPASAMGSDTLKPVTLGLYGMVSLATFTDRGALMMGALLGVLPVIVIFLGLQRYWQSGLAAGAVKG